MPTTSSAINLGTTNWKFIGHEVLQQENASLIAGYAAELALCDLRFGNPIYCKHSGCMFYSTKQYGWSREPWRILVEVCSCGCFEIRQPLRPHAGWGPHGANRPIGGPVVTSTDINFSQGTEIEKSDNINRMIIPTDLSFNPFI